MNLILSKTKLSVFGLAVFFISGCSTQYAPHATIPARKMESQRIGAGGAQMIKSGMTGQDVINALGTPNILTSDKDGLETWVYDKISNDYEYVTAQDGGWFFSPKSQQSGISISSTRTLIVVINFDKDKKVKNVQFRQTSY